MIISSVQVRECAAKERTLWAYPHDLLERGLVAPAPASMPAAMRLLPSSHLSSLMVGVPFTFPPPTPPQYNFSPEDVGFQVTSPTCTLIIVCDKADPFS